MTVKGLLRYCIALLIATLLLALLLPLAGIPRAQLFFPAFAYSNARGKVSGVVSAKRQPPTSNPFKVGDHIDLIDYRFRAPYTPLLFGPQKSEPNHVYTGTVLVKEDYFDKVQVGQAVPVKYEKTYPVISGIDEPGVGRSGATGSGIFSGWLIWAVVSIVLAYLIAPWLERVMLRESY